MMSLSLETKEALRSQHEFYFINILELRPPVLIILDYRPSKGAPPLSIAFDGDLGSKCWMSEKNVRVIDENSPSLHEQYKNFEFNGHYLYGFSVKAFTQFYFDSIDGINRACERLYVHIVWPD